MHWCWVDAVLQGTDWVCFTGTIATPVAIVQFSENFPENGLQIKEFGEQGRGGWVYFWTCI